MAILSCLADSQYALDHPEIALRISGGAYWVSGGGSYWLDPGHPDTISYLTGMIRTEEVGNMASACSVYPEVRQKLLELQRALAVRQPVVMDGRDIGTVVLPDAETKVYLTASVEVRARRRYRELQEKGAACDIAEIEKDIRERDWRDMHRETAPLRQAEDAVLVDSSCMTAAEVTDEILALVRREEV